KPAGMRPLSPTRARETESNTWSLRRVAGAPLVKRVPMCWPPTRWGIDGFRKKKSKKSQRSGAATKIKPRSRQGRKEGPPGLTKCRNRDKNTDHLCSKAVLNFTLRKLTKILSEKRYIQRRDSQNPFPFQTQKPYKPSKSLCSEIALLRSGRCLSKK